MTPKEAILALVSSRDLTREEAASVMRAIMTGDATPPRWGPSSPPSP